MCDTNERSSKNRRANKRTIEGIWSGPKLKGFLIQLWSSRLGRSNANGGGQLQGIS